MSLAVTPVGPGGSAGVGEVVEFDVPSKVSVGEVVDAKVVGKVTVNAEVMNFIVGVAYQDGPTDSIQFFDGKVWHPLNKHSVAFITIGMAVGGREYTAVIKLKFPKEGTYDVRGVVGYIKPGDGIVVDDYVDKYVEVVKGKPPTPPTIPKLGGDVLYVGMGTAFGSLAGYVATKNAKGALAGAVLGGGLGYLLTHLSELKNVFKQSK